MSRYNTPRRRSPLSNPFTWIVPALIVIAVIGIAVFNLVLYPTSGGTATACTVDDKDRSTSSEGTSVYRVYSSCGVFEVQDYLLGGRFDSADRYNQIKVGETYNFETIGWRFPLLSQFPNILDARKS